MPDSPSIETVPLTHSTPIHCQDCGEDVRLAFTGKDEGINICCDCHQMDTIPYYFKIDDLPDEWGLSQ